VDVAVSGDRGCCLSQQLAPESYLFAVATGFGRIGGEAAAPLALGKLRHELERRVRGVLFRRSQRKARTVTGALSGAMASVNDELHARSASHEDYVTAGVSMTAVLLVAERAYLAHIGSTAAYLARDGSTMPLTKNDAFDGDRGLPILMRALGLTPSLDLSVSAFSLFDGDALVLAGRPLPETSERLIVSFSSDAEPQVPAPVKAHTAQSILTGALAAVLFYALLAIR